MICFDVPCDIIQWTNVRSSVLRVPGSLHRLFFPWLTEANHHSKWHQFPRISHDIAADNVRFTFFCYIHNTLHSNIWLVRTQLSVSLRKLEYTDFFSITCAPSELSVIDHTYCLFFQSSVSYLAVLSFHIFLRLSRGVPSTFAPWSFSFCKHPNLLNFNLSHVLLLIVVMSLERGWAHCITHTPLCSHPKYLLYFSFFDHLSISPMLRRWFSCAYMLDGADWTYYDVRC